MISLNKEFSEVLKILSQKEPELFNFLRLYFEATEIVLAKKARVAGDDTMNHRQQGASLAMGDLVEMFKNVDGNFERFQKPLREKAMNRGEGFS